MGKKLKVFLWTGVLTDYTDGVMFAVATTVEEARSMLVEKLGYVPNRIEQDSQVITDKFAFTLQGGS